MAIWQGPALLSYNDAVFRWAVCGSVVPVPCLVSLVQPRGGAVQFMLFAAFGSSSDSSVQAPPNL